MTAAMKASVPQNSRLQRSVDANDLDRRADSGPDRDILETASGFIRAIVCGASIIRLQPDPRQFRCATADPAALDA